MEIQAEVIDFQSLNSFLEKTISNALLPGSETSYSDTKLSKIVEKRINHLRLKYKNKYKDVLIAIFVHPYQYQSSGASSIIRLNPLSCNNLDTLKESFEREKKNFDRYKGDILKLQSYLLLLTLNYHVEKNFKTFKSRIVQN